MVTASTPSASSASSVSKVRQPASSVARARCAAQGIDNADQSDVRQTRQHARMVAAHHAGADDADAKRVFRPGFRTRPELLGTHFIDPDQIKRETPRRFLARRHTCGECRDDICGHDLMQRITSANRQKP